MKEKNKFANMYLLNQKKFNSVKKEMNPLPECEMNNTRGGDRYIFDESGVLLDIETCSGSYFVVGNKEHEVSGEMHCQHDSGFIQITGSGIGANDFEFLAQETHSEWAHFYKNNAQGGMLFSTYNQHQIDLDYLQTQDSDGKPINYDCITHNHGDGNDNYNYNDMYSLPSDADKNRIARLSQLGINNFYIYNERYSQGNRQSYNTMSYSMEDYCYDHNIPIN